MIIEDRGAGNDPKFFYFLFLFLFFFFFWGGGSLSPPMAQHFYSGQYGSNAPPKNKKIKKKRVMICLSQGGLRSLSALQQI